MDDLSLYDRKGKKAGGSAGLLFPMLLSVALIIGSIAFIEYGLPLQNSGNAETTSAKAPTPRTTHGVISRSPVVSVDRSELPTVTEDVQLIDAVARTADGSSNEVANELQQLVAPGTERSPSQREASVAAPADIGEGEDVTVLMPAQEIRMATDDEIERLYSTLPEEPEEVEVFVAEPELLEDTKPAEVLAAEPEEPPVVVSEPARRPIRAVSRARPEDARCLISRRELASVRSMIAEEGVEEERFKFLTEQESYYWDQVVEHCR